jgi:hypothetical protein
LKTKATCCWRSPPRAHADVPGQRSAAAVKRQGNKIINIPSAEAAKGEDGLAHLFLLPPQSTLTIHVGKRKIKLRPEELQKVVGERGRRGSLMRGLQRIDRVEIDSPRAATRATAKSNVYPPLIRRGNSIKFPVKSLFIRALRLTIRARNKVLTWPQVKYNCQLLGLQR